MRKERARDAGRGLAIEEFTRRFGDTLAVDALDLTVGRGEIVGLVGRNGAGKTTTMRAVMGILSPDAGTLTWDGTPIDRIDRDRFGYMPEERGLYPQMRLLDQIAYFGTLRGLSHADAHAKAGEWIERLGLAGREADKITALSHGNQQRAQLAVTLVHDPDLLVLDEPFSGLDPAGVDELGRTLARRAEAGTAVLFSSHQLDLVERMCHRVVIVDAGRVLAAGTLDELRGRFPRRLRVEVDAPSSWASKVRGASVVSEDDDGVILVLDEGTSPQSVLDVATAAGPLVHFGFEEERLSDMYLEMVNA